MIAEHIASILLGVTLISAFICVFFFTYGRIVERQTVAKQAEYLADALTDDISLLLLPETAKKLSDEIKQIDLSELKSEDEKVEENNRKIMTTALIVVGCAVVVGISACVWMSVHFEFSFKKILIFNLAALFFVGLTEFLFLTFIVKNYISADPNVVYASILENMMSEQKK